MNDVHDEYDGHTASDLEGGGVDLSHDESDETYDPYYIGGSRKKKRSFSGCLAVLVALAVILGGGYVFGSKGYHFLKDHLSSLSSGSDYPGPGQGQVMIEVKSGETISEIRSHEDVTELSEPVPDIRTSSYR